MLMFSKEGRYKVFVHTDPQSSSEPCPVDASLELVIYGDDGKTSEILLRQPIDLETSTNPETVPVFKPGQMDEFEVGIVFVYNHAMCEVPLQSNNLERWKVF